jgi:hypothetical protein
MSQIRLSRTEEIDTVLSYFRKQYPLLSESEIIKMVLSEKYREKQFTESVIDLESQPNMKDVQEQILTPPHNLAPFRNDRSIERSKRPRQQ